MNPVELKEALQKTIQDAGKSVKSIDVKRIDATSTEVKIVWGNEN